MKLFEASEELKQEYVARIPSPQFLDGNVNPGTMVSLESIRAAKERQFGPDDIVIISYPKSGTTWSAEILSAIAHEGDTNALQSRRIEDRVPWIEKIKKAANDCNGKSVVSGKKRVWFTHLPLRHLPASIREGKCKVLYVARNPKDNAVSYFHFHKIARHLGLARDMTWDEFFRLHYSGFIWCGSWFAHVRDYWKFSRENPNVKFVRYEDLQSNLLKEVESIEQFVEIPLSTDNRLQIVDHCTFDTMKENIMANRSGAKSFDQSFGKFMRKGMVGDWKNYFTIAQSEAFDELYKREMDGCGLEFEFE